MCNMDEAKYPYQIAQLWHSLSATLGVAGVLEFPLVKTRYCLRVQTVYQETILITKYTRLSRVCRHSRVGTTRARSPDCSSGSVSYVIIPRLPRELLNRNTSLVVRVMFSNPPTSLRLNPFLFSR